MLRQRKRAFKKQPHPSQETVRKRPTQAYRENWNLIFGTKKKR